MELGRAPAVLATRYCTRSQWIIQLKRCVYSLDPQFSCDTANDFSRKLRTFVTILKCVVELQIFPSEISISISGGKKHI